ncbi:MAG: hypothetical protein JW797_02200 [Bradymonadales bacterium]|nr:hypothetical protein [Bradymonadales bacterium]
MLGQTAPDLLVDGEGRPYFLWDCELTLDQFTQGLNHPDPTHRAYLLGKLMRQAKPEDVFHFASLSTIRSSWPLVEKHLGKSLDFWRWLLDAWEDPADADR